MALSSNDNMIVEHPQDYYGILGITRTASQKEIRSAYALYQEHRLCDMPTAMEDGKEEPEIAVVYIKRTPGKDFFSYMTYLTPVLEGKPVLQSIYKINKDNMLVFSSYGEGKVVSVFSEADKYSISDDFIKQKLWLLNFVKRAGHLERSCYGENDFLQKPAAKLKAAYDVLFNLKKRTSYDALLDGYFQETYAAIKAKDVSVLMRMISVAKPHLCFNATDNQARSIVERLVTEKDAASLQFLMEHFRQHLSVYQLAFMGVHLTPSEIAKDPKNAVEGYARGNHPQLAAQALALDPDPERHAKALLGYIVADNVSEAEKIVALVNDDSSLSAGLYQGGYLKDSKRLVSFLASTKSSLSDRILKAVSAPLKKTLLSDEELNVREDLPFYAALAKKCRAGLFTITDDLSFIAIFNQAIEEAKTITVPGYIETENSKEEFIAALRALKEKTMADYLAQQFKNPQDPLTIAKAAQTLVKDIYDPATRSSAISTFEQAINPFKTTWDWKMILGAVIGFALGFILGAAIGAGVSPLAAVTALGAGVVGAWIGASLFGATMAVAGGALGVKCLHLQDPLRQTIATGTKISNTLTRG